MANNIGTLVTAPIRPASDADTFPSAYANDLLGGHHSVADMTARDAIPSSRREVGMVAYVQSTGQEYQLIGGTDNANWQLHATGSASIPVTTVLCVDGNRTDSYVESGSISTPYKTIQAAVNRIAANADNTQAHPYTIRIAAGTYPENVLLEDSHLVSLSIIADGIVWISPTTGMALRSEHNNSNLMELRVWNVFFTGTSSPIISFKCDTDNVSMLAYENDWNDCYWIGDVHFANFITYDFRGPAAIVAGNIVMENMIAGEVGGEWTGNLTLTWDDTHPKPNAASWGVESQSPYMFFNSQFGVAKGSYTIGNNCILQFRNSTAAYVGYGMELFETPGTVTVLSGGEFINYGTFLAGYVDVKSGGKFINYGGWYDTTKLTIESGGTFTDLGSSIGVQANLVTHAALTSGVHGLGTAAGHAATDFDSSGASTSAVSTHAALTSGVHGLGTAAGHATTDFDSSGAATSAVSTHAALTSGVHGLGTAAGHAATDFATVNANGVLSSTIVPSLGTISASTYAARVLNRSSLIGYWRMDDASGNLVDSVGSYAGVPSTSGKIKYHAPGLLANDGNYSVFLNMGIMDYVALSTTPSAFDWENNQPWTVEAMIQPDYTTGATMVIYDKTSGSPFRGTQVWLSHTGGSYYLHVTISNTWASNLIDVTGSIDLATSQEPKHVAVTYDGSLDWTKIKMYVNGVLDVSATSAYHSLSGTIKNAVNPNFGNTNISQGGTSKNFIGSLDELAIYNAVLPANVIADDARLATTSHFISPIPPTATTTNSPIPIIYDVEEGWDFGNDHGVCVMLSLANAGYCRPILFNNSNQIEAGPGAILAHLRYYGWDNCPISSCQLAEGMGPSGMPSAYAVYLLSHVSPAITAPYNARSGFVSDVVGYRTALVAEADNSVVVAINGPANSYDNFLNSPADGISPLTGVQIAAKKIRAVCWMAGEWPDSSIAFDGQNYEYNMNVTAVKNADVFAKSPANIPILVSGWKVGSTPVVGTAVTNLAATNPLKIASDKYYSDISYPLNTGRPIWAEVTCINAVFGVTGGWLKILSPRGTVTINTSTGANSWTPTPGNVYYVGKQATDAAIAAYINGLFTNYQ